MDKPQSAGIHGIHKIHEDGWNLDVSSEEEEADDDSMHRFSMLVSTSFSKVECVHEERPGGRTTRAVHL
jgi:hypothetical protein